MVDLPQPDTEQSTARLLFLGDRALAQGFALIGFETWPDATIEQLDQVLEELRNERRGALVVLDQQLAAGDSRLLPRIEADGRHVAIIEVPALADAQGFHLDVDDELQALLAGAQLEG
jgi:vacuolar-type H+-ATPase subunit F/Vma7